MESEIDKFLKDYEDKNINISYGDKGDKNKFDAENITKSLKKLRNKFISILTNLMKSIINLWTML